VRPHTASAGRVLGRGGPHVGGCRLRRGRGGRPADHRVEPAVVLRHQHLARGPVLRGTGTGDRRSGAHAAGCSCRTAQGQGVDRAGRDVHHAPVVHRGLSVSATARTGGALALRQQAQEDAQGAGAGTQATQAGCPGEAVVAARDRGGAALSGRHRGQSTARPRDPRRSGTKGTVDGQPRNGRRVRYFYDTEFIDNGRTIELISIGVAAEDGREYYAISTEFNPDRAGSWVRKHVLPKLPSPSSPL